MAETGESAPDEASGSEDGPTSRGESDASDRTGRIGTHHVTEWKTRSGKWAYDRHRELADRIGPRKAVATAATVGLGVAIGTTWLGTLIYDSVTGNNGFEKLDHPALRTAKRLRSPLTNASAAGIARAFGVYGGPLLALGSGIALSIRDKKATPSGMIGAAAGGSLAMTLLGKDLIHRNRLSHRDAIAPFEHSPSFPSGHTINATTVIGASAYLLALGHQKESTERITVVAAVTAIITVGLSRVLLGAHWLTDVMMGWVAGAGWLSTVITAHRLFVSLEEEQRAQESGA